MISKLIGEVKIKVPTFIKSAKKLNIKKYIKITNKNKLTILAERLNE